MAQRQRIWIIPFAAAILSALGLVGEAPASDHRDDAGVTNAGLPHPHVRLVANDHVPKLPIDLVDLASSAEGLADDNEDDFAQSWFDPVSGKIVLAASSDSGLSLAEQVFGSNPRVEIRPVRHSYNDLMAMDDRLINEIPILRAIGYMSGIAPESNGLYFRLSRPLTDDELRQLEGIVAGLGVTLEVQVDPRGANSTTADGRLEDDSPYSGGFRYGTVNPISMPTSHDQQDRALQHGSDRQRHGHVL